MQRRPDWEQRLAAYLEEVRDRPHEYGRHDCALHGANVVRALTGRDYGRRFRGHYKTARGAIRVLKTRGKGSLEATFDDRLPTVAPALAQRGDLVLAGGSIGVCIGSDALFVGQEGEAEGLVRIPRRDWTKAWRV